MNKTNIKSTNITIKQTQTNIDIRIKSSQLIPFTVNIKNKDHKQD